MSHTLHLGLPLQDTQPHDYTLTTLGLILRFYFLDLSSHNNLSAVCSSPINLLNNGLDTLGPHWQRYPISHHMP